MICAVFFLKSHIIENNLKSEGLYQQPQIYSRLNKQLI